MAKIEYQGDEMNSDRTLAESERLRRLYETILRSTPDFVYVFDLEHRFVYANAALLAMWGQTWETAIGKNCLELGYEPWHAEMHDREIEQVVATKQPIRGLVPFKGTHGPRMYDYIFTPVIGPNGEVEAVAGTTRDVTEGVAAEAALRESEGRYRSLFESMSEGFCILELIYNADNDPVDYRFLQVNPAFEHISGLKDAVGRTIREIVPGIARSWIEAFNEVAATCQPKQIVERARTTGKWFDVHAFCLVEAGGRKVAAVFGDVTARKQREANLAFLSEVDFELARLTSATEIMRVVGAKIGEYLSLAGCNFCRVDEAANQLTTDFGWSNDDVPNLVRTYRLSEYFSEEFTRAGRAGEIVLIRDTQTDPRVGSESYAELRIGSFVMVPFHRDGHWTDLFGAVDSRPRDWRQDEFELLQELAVRIFPRLERARAEQALRESEERFRAAVGAIGVLWTNSADGRMEGEQLGWASLTGQTWEQYEGYGWSRAVHPSDVEPTIQAWQDAVREKRPFVFEHRVLTHDGQWRQFSIRAVPVFDPDGSLREWVGVHVDITEAREHERALHESEAQYRQIAEGLPQMVWSAGPDGHRDYFNGRWIEFTGVGLRESSSPWTAALHPDDVEVAVEAWNYAVNSGETFQAEYRLKARDGRYRWFLGRAIAIRNEEGEIVRWFGTCTDIEQQKTTQALLQITNDFAAALAADLDLERIVQSLTDASTTSIGAEFGSFFYNVVNEQGEAFLLFTLSGAPKEAFEKLGLPRATPVFAPTFRAERIVRSDDITKDPLYGKMAGPHHGMPQGHLPVVSYLAVPVVSRSGEVIGGLFFGHSQPGMFTKGHEQVVSSFAAQAALAMDNARLFDRVRAMNDELETMVEVRTSELLAAVESLQGFTYHVSHDLRAPLRAIAANCRILQEDFGTELSPEANQLLVRQADAATRLGRLVDDLLRLSRISRQDLVREPIDMTALAREVYVEAISTHPYSKSTIEVEEGLFAEADPRLLRLALLNILENAVKYSPDGGLIHVGKEPDGSYFVSDQGIGMEPQYLSKIFEPFQRLHRDEEFSGTGIGLANVKQIIERHGGAVWAESAPGHGSRIRFKL